MTRLARSHQSENFPDRVARNFVGDRLERERERERFNIDCSGLESGNVVESAAKIEENVADLARYDDHVCNQLYA